MTLVTKAEFARRAKEAVGREVARPMVNYWEKKGRIVVVDGKVDLEASIDLLKSTGGSRPDVSERHAIEHEEKRESMYSDAVDSRASGSDIAIAKARRVRTVADARIKAAEAEMREMERDKLAGRLVDKEDVEFVLKDYGATLRSLMETFADRVTPLVLPLTDFEEVHAVLSEEASRVVTDLAESMRRKTADYAF